MSDKKARIKVDFTKELDANRKCVFSIEGDFTEVKETDGEFDLSINYTLNNKDIEKIIKQLTMLKKAK